MITLFALLFLCSLIVLSSAKTIKANTTIVRNQLFEDQAFEAGEAGVEFGLMHLKDNFSTILMDSNLDGFIEPYAPATITNVDNSNNTAYTITYSNPIANNFDIIQLSVNGTSDSGNVTKALTQLAIRIPFMEHTPPAGLITQYGVSLGGNVDIENTAIGVENTETATTIWTGGGTTLSGSASTTCGTNCGSDKNNTNSDIVQDEFFLNFMGVDKATAKANADIVLNYASDQNLSDILNPDSNDGKVIWINQSSGSAKFSGNATIGSPTAPVILIVDGDFKANGTTLVAVI